MERYQRKEEGATVPMAVNDVCEDHQYDQVLQRAHVPEDPHLEWIQDVSCKN